VPPSTRWPHRSKPAAGTAGPKDPKAPLGYWCPEPAKASGLSTQGAELAKAQIPAYMKGRFLMIMMTMTTMVMSQAKTMVMSVHGPKTREGFNEQFISIQCAERRD
jgi:hypothetical protein